MSEQKEIKSFDDFVKLFDRALELFPIQGNKFSINVEVTKPSDYQKLESRIKELEEENKRFREALTEVMKVSGTSCLHHLIAAKALCHNTSS